MHSLAKGLSHHMTARFVIDESSSRLDRYETCALHEQDVDLRSVPRWKDTVFVQGGTLNPLKKKFTSEEF